MNLLAFLLTGFTLAHGPARPTTAPPDSVGVELRNGQRLLKHRVAKGETLFGLARRYNVSVDQLQAANPAVKGGLTLGQVVLVPRGATGASKPAATAAKPTSPANPASAAVPARYTVAKGENVYAIARRFNLSPTEIMRLNHLSPTTGVQVGQQLILTGAEAPAATTASTAPEPATTPAPKPAVPVVKETPKEVPKNETIGAITPATPAEKEAEKEKEKAPTRASELIARVTESGMAAVIEKSVTDKYLALHKTAPVGTIMQVKNSMNGQSVYVRVIGQLPDTGENNNILVRLSPRAVQKLGTPDARFRVETSYVP